MSNSANVRLEGYEYCLRKLPRDRTLCTTECYCATLRLDHEAVEELVRQFARRLGR